MLMSYSQPAQNETQCDLTANAMGTTDMKSAPYRHAARTPVSIAGPEAFGSAPEAERELLLLCTDLLAIGDAGGSPGPCSGAGALSRALAGAAKRDRGNGIAARRRR